MATPAAPEIAEGAGASPLPTEAAEVIARVNGKAITVAQVKAQAEAASTDARGGLQALVDSEILVAEAERRGLNRSSEVRDAMQREMVRRFLADTFERDVTPASVSDQELRKAYLRFRARLDHPELRMVTHILARVQSSDDEARRNTVRKRAEEVCRRALQIHDVQSFAALATQLSDDAVKLTTEQVATAREHWTEKPFADAAFRLAHPGDISEVVQTVFGYHVIYFERTIPEERISYDQAREKLRESLWPELRRREFTRFTDGLVAKHALAVYPSRLEDDSPRAPTEARGGP